MLPQRLHIKLPRNRWAHHPGIRIPLRELCELDGNAENRFVSGGEKDAARIVCRGIAAALEVEAEWTRETDEALAELG